MSDSSSFTPPSGYGGAATPVTMSAILGALQNLVTATNAQAQYVKGSLGAAASGDLSGIYPGPITVLSTHLSVPLPVVQGGTGNTTGGPSGAAGGDLSGSYPNPTVASINGNPLGSTTPTSGDLLIGSGTQWVTHAISGDATLTSTGIIAVTRINGVTLGSTTASAGNLLVGSGTQWVTNAISGDVTLTSTGVTTVTQVNGVALGSTAATAGNLLVGSGTQWITRSITGDVTITSSGITAVTRINGVALGAATATAGNLLIGSGTQWVTNAISGDGSLSSAGALTITKTSGAVFGPYATAAQGQLPGTTTNDNAASGDIGQEIESVVVVGSAVSLATGTPLAVTSITLTAGDWDVWAYCGFTGGATTTVNSLIGSISIVNNTLDQTRGRWASQVPAGATVFNTLANQQFAAGQERLSLNGATPVYLVAQAAFGTSTCAAFGAILARRRR